MKKFELNPHGVCEDPNEYLLVKNKECEIIIETAFIENKWRAGNNITFGNFGCGGLPSPHDKPFDTERECVENEIKWTEQYLERDNVKNLAHLREVFKQKLNEFFPTEIQLTLF